MCRYFVSYKDDEGCTGKTLVISSTPLNKNEIIDALNDQFQENEIDARVIEVDVQEVGLVTGFVKHFIHNRA